MARELPPQCPGAAHHMMGCGDRREQVFLDDADWCLFAPRGLAAAGDGVLRIGQSEGSL
jgi:hypothetical protein